MIRLTVANHKGGVGKTTTVLTLARCFADEGLRVLVVDTDPQGNVWITFNQKFKERPQYLIHHVFEEDEDHNLVFPVEKAVYPIQERISAIFSSRATVKAETELAARGAREFLLTQIMGPIERNYDVILFDVAPSISNLQSCAMAYTRDVLIPVCMDTLSVEGVVSSLGGMNLLNKHLRLGCRCVGLLPTMLDRRLQTTQVISHTLDDLSAERSIPLLPGIRTDQSVIKAVRNSQFLHDFDPKSRALEDYQALSSYLLTHTYSEAAKA